MSEDVKQFTFFETPGHGYLQVPLEFLRQLEIQHLISRYSYTAKNDAGDKVVFCEEDCDMAIVCTRMELDGIKFQIDDEYVDDDWRDELDHYDGDYDEYGELPQRTDGLEQFLGTGEDDDDWEEEEVEEEDE